MMFGRIQSDNCHPHQSAFCQILDANLWSKWWHDSRKHHPKSWCFSVGFSTFLNLCISFHLTISHTAFPLHVGNPPSLEKQQLVAMFNPFYWDLDFGKVRQSKNKSHYKWYCNLKCYTDIQYSKTILHIATALQCTHKQWFGHDREVFTPGSQMFNRRCQGDAIQQTFQCNSMESQFWCSAEPSC